MPHTRDNYGKLTDLTLKMAGDLAATIALPVFVLVWIGRRLDLRSGHSKPVFVALAILLAFVVSTVMIGKKAVKYGDKYIAITSATDKSDDKDEA